MLLFFVQVLMLGCVLLLLAMLLAFAAFVGVGLIHRKFERGVLITGAFVLGALASIFGIWHLVPSGWTLPFWTTLEASVNAKQYGHPVEHYAQGIVLMLIFGAALGGGVGAATAVLGVMLRRRMAHAGA